MANISILFFCLVFTLNLLVPVAIWSQKADPTVMDFKVQALYRAAMLTWKVKDGLKNPVEVGDQVMIDE